MWWRFLFWAASTTFPFPEESHRHLSQHSVLWRSLSGIALTLVTWSRQNGLVPAPLRGRLVETDTKARIIITLNAIWHCYVMEWSGSCCRYPTSHSGKRETTAGNVQQQQDFYFADQTSTNTRDTRGQTCMVSAGSMQMYVLVGVKPLPLAVCRLQDVEWSGSLNQIGIKTGIHASINQMRIMMYYYYYSLLISTLPVHSPPFFPNLSRFFLCWLWLTHGSCVGPQNKIGHSAGGRFPCWVPAEYK